jgi:hypothetical protein
MPIPGASNPDAPVPEGMRRNINRNTKLERKESPTEYYITEADAISKCEDLARTNPMVPHAVLSVTAVRETARPEVINKRFNDSGELILV